MGNSCHCCTFGCLRTNQIVPAECGGISHVPDQNLDRFTPCSNQRGNNQDSTDLVSTEKKKGLIEKVVEATKEDRGHVEEDNEIKQWIGNILQNSRQPSSVIFCNKRHEAMRYRFQRVIQRMAYSSTIIEIAEDKEKSNDGCQSQANDKFSNADLNLHKNLRAWQTSHSSHARQDVESTAVKHRRHKIRPRYAKWLKNERRSTVVPLVQTAQSSDPVEESSEEGTSTGQDNQFDRTSRSQCPERPHVTTTWFDEDFQEAVLTDPVSEVEGGVDHVGGGLAKKRSGLLNEPVEGTLRKADVNDMGNNRRENGNTSISGLFMSRRPSSSDDRHMTSDQQQHGGGLLRGMFRRRDTPFVVYNYKNDKES